MIDRNQAGGENTTGPRVDLKVDRRLYAILALHFFNNPSEGDLKKEKEPKRKKAAEGEACGN
jgi:hypothetical protein